MTGVIPGRGAYEALRASYEHGTDLAWMLTATWDRLSDDDRAVFAAVQQAAVNATVSGLMDAAGTTLEEVTAAVTAAVPETPAARVPLGRWACDFCPQVFERLTEAEDHVRGEHGAALDAAPHDDGTTYCTGLPPHEHDVTRLVLSELTLNAIQAEATRAYLKHGDNSMLGTRYSAGDRLAILMEEVGEVAHELTYDQSGDKDKLVRELIQVAAMAASWVEYLEGGAR